MVRRAVTAAHSSKALTTERRRASSSLIATQALAIAVGVFILLWVLDLPFRRTYAPRQDDITALVDGLLLLPHASWVHWFTRGHFDFFDPYPEWPLHQTAFARPVFQFLIYLAHFPLGRNWASYLAINYAGVAGVVALAFVIGRGALRLGTGPALMAAALVLLSPAVLEYSIWEIGYASEALAAILIGCAFLAIASGRDCLCFFLLLIALFTKETALWAPVAAAATVLLRSSPTGEPRQRARAAALMLLPLAIWIAYRFAFFAGVGGTYATADYTPFFGFAKLTAQKLLAIQSLFVSQAELPGSAAGTAIDEASRIATTLLLVVLLCASAGGLFGSMRRSWSRGLRDQSLAVVDAQTLVIVWAVLGIAFFFAIPLGHPRYAASGILFAWPAIIGEAARWRRPFLRYAVALCLVLPLPRATEALATNITQPPNGAYIRNMEAMDTAIRGLPPEIRQVYIVPAGGLVPASPDYLQVFLGVPVNIIRLADVIWRCKDSSDRLDFAHGDADGITKLEMTAPACASFDFVYSRADLGARRGSHLPRSDSISYDLPEASFSVLNDRHWLSVDLGRRMIVHIRTAGPARFIIEDRGPGGGITWFDTP